MNKERNPVNRDGDPIMSEIKPGIRLLLVDDEVEFREAARRAFVRQGFEVSEAESGERALEILKTTRPNIVVLDLKMQGIDGIRTLQQIRLTDKELPVIILTGHGSFDDALSGIQLGVVDFVQKPVDLKHLGERIRNLVSSGGERPLREKGIAELMVPEFLYSRIYHDQTVLEAVEALKAAQRRPPLEDDSDQGRRTLLVFDREERFVGLINAADIVRVVIPSFLLESPYSSYLTGMFLAQAKVVGKLPIRAAVRSPLSIEEDIPTMEAAYLMVSHHLSHVAVTRSGEFVGILRPEDLYRELGNSI